MKRKREREIEREGVELTAETPPPRMMYLKVLAIVEVCC